MIMKPDMYNGHPTKVAITHYYTHYYTLLYTLLYTITHLYVIS